MERTEMEAKMVELKDFAERKAKAYNAKIIEGNYDSKLDDEISDAVNEYTRYARIIAFDECKAAENPMHEACVRLTYETIRAKDEPIDDEGKSKIKKKVIEPIDKPIDLKKLRKHCDKQLGEDPDWIYALEKFNFLLTAQKAVDLGIDPKEINDSYAMAEISKQYDLGRNPASKTKLLDTLTRIVRMMLGDDYKPTSHDVNYLLSIWSRKGRAALKVSCANHAHMRQYAQEICHRILTGKSYGVEFKAKKK